MACVWSTTPFEAAENARHFEELMDTRMLAVSSRAADGPGALEALASLEIAEHLARRVQHPSQLVLRGLDAAGLSAVLEGRLSSNT